MELRNGLPDNISMHGMNLEASANVLKQCHGKVTSQVLTELHEPVQQIRMRQRLIPQGQSEIPQKRESRLAGLWIQKPGTNRIQRIERHAECHGLAVPEAELCQGL
jgi:hypothetical protein